MRFFCVLFAVSLVAQPVKSGVDVDAIDKTCKPCDDFWRHASGAWMDKNPIPAARAAWGPINLLVESNQERIRTILEAAAASKAAAGSNERKIGDLYGACMDSARRNTLGIAPLRPDLEAIDKIQTRDQLKAELLRQLVTDGAAPVGVDSIEDLKDTTRVITYINAGGISLPDRDYYFRDDERSKKIREEFVAHVDRMLAFLGPGADGAGAKILAFETEFARAMKPRVELRDPYAIYNKMDLAGLEELTGNLAWRQMAKSLRIPEAGPYMVGQPAAVKNLGKQIGEAPLETWKLWLRWRTVKESAAFLSEAVETEEFAFSGKVLSGAKEQLPQWRRCTARVDAALGEALGEAFVKKHFPPVAKQRMNQLVENLRAAMKEELEKADWLAAETRKNALAKLNGFEAKIGYPAKWRSYAAVTVKRGDYHASVRSASLANRAYELAKIGKPTERNDWGMSPPTVNAYYNPPKNEIVFPAGILQPPLFDMEADDAVNYGAIGAVIGHEMGHGFDDQGSKFDFSGNLQNWWTKEDRKKFDERASCVVEQFNNLDVGDKLRHNGRLVVGEAMGDLGGLTIAYRAYQRSLRGKPAPPVLDGYTADQRFFLAFGRVWGSQSRPEALRLQLQTDPHPVARFRANATLMNMPEFHKAFQCKLGDAMVRPPEKQCKLW